MVVVEGGLGGKEEKVTKSKRKPKASKATVSDPTTDPSLTLTPTSKLTPLMAEELSHPNLRPPKGKKIAELLETMTTIDGAVNAANSVKFHDKARVDRVMITESETGDTIVKVRLRSSRVPAIGDKLASQGPQKGVIGELRAKVDMPFTADGMTPDVLIVTHCLKGDTRIMTSTGPVMIQDLVANPTIARVMSCDSITGICVWGGITNAFKIGHHRPMVRVTSMSGLSVDVTPDHRLQVLSRAADGTYKPLMKAVQELTPYRDRLVVRGGPTAALSNDGPGLHISWSDTDEIVPAFETLQFLGYEGAISLWRAKLLAKLLGFVHSQRYLTQQTHAVRLHISSTADCCEVLGDTRRLGFTVLIDEYVPSDEVQYNLTLSADLSKLLAKLGAKTATVPEWIVRGPDSIKASYLSGYHGSSGSEFLMTRHASEIRVNAMKFSAYPSVLEQYVKLYTDLGVEVRQSSVLPLTIEFNQREDNLLRLADVIDYGYCSAKRNASAAPIHWLRLKSRGYVLDYSRFLELTSPFTQVEIQAIRNQDYTILGQYDTRRGIMYDLLTEITPSEPGNVYDFTTISTYHNFVANGLVSSNCIPSRMTVAQLTSMMAGVVACTSGRLVDSTSFKENENVAASLARSLLDHGLTPHGSTVMYDGITGEQLEGEVFMGVTTYQRMRQQTVDKYHCRARGQVQLLTRQPTEGKATSGGLRLGEMERDSICLNAYITISPGIAVQLRDLETNRGSVLTMDMDSVTRNIISMRQLGWHRKGFSPCLQAQLQDGRILTATHNHEIMTSNGNWVTMERLVPGTSRVAVTMEGAHRDLSDGALGGWSLQAGEFTINQTRQALAFARLLGHTLADGTRSGFAGAWSLGTEADCIVMIEDLELLCGQPRRTYRFDGIVYRVCMPACLVRAFAT